MSLDDATCKLCSGPRVGSIKSHLVPDWMMRSCADEHGRIAVVTLEDEKTSLYSHKKRARNIPGMDVDIDLLCSDCEGRFSQWENYGKRALVLGQGVCIREKRGVSPDGRRTIRWQVMIGLDYEKLKLFVLSMIWRMSASRVDIALQFDLGPHEETIRHLLCAGNAGPISVYPILMYKVFFADDIFRLAAAHISRDKGGYVANIFGGGFWFMARISGHAVPNEEKNLCLTPDRPYYVPILDARDVGWIRTMNLQ